MQRNSLPLVNAVNFLLNVAIQGSLIFIPLLSAQLGASDFQVGLVGAAYGTAFLLSSLFSGRQSDRLGRLAFVRAGLLLATIGFGAQMLARDLLTLALLRAGVGLSLGVTMPALLAYAFEAGADMGRFSSYGSLGWIGGALAAALLVRFDRLFALSMLCCVVALACSGFFPRGRERASTGEANGQGLPGLGAAIRRGGAVYLAVFLRHLGASAVWIILPLYFASLGLGQSWVGILQGINFSVQFIVMRRLERFEPRRVFAFGQVLSILVFLAYAVITRPGPLVAVQALLGVAWACLYVGALILVLRAGEERGTASGIFQATLNLCGAAGPFLGGLIAQLWGYRGLMLFAAALGMAGLAVALPRGTGKETAEAGSRAGR